MNATVMRARRIGWMLETAEKTIRAANLALAEVDDSDSSQEMAGVHEIGDLLVLLMSELDSSGSNPELDGLTGSRPGPIANFSRRLASLYSAAAARVVVAGSSGANIALHGFVMPSLAAAGRRTVLVDRDAHLSLIGGLAVSGLRVRWVYRRYDEHHDVQTPISAAQVAAALRADPAIAAVCLTSPTYDGFDVAIEEIAAVCKPLGVYLIIDGAWGPGYGALTPAGFPPSATKRGADVAVISLHKKGLAPSQIAAVLFNSQKHAELFDVAGNVGFQTTSPSYVLLGLAEHLMDRLAAGSLTRAWTGAVKAANEFAARIGEAHPACRIVRCTDVGAASGDPGHVLVHVAGAGVTGYELQTAMSGRGLDAEKPTRDTVLFLMGPHEADRVDTQIAVMREAFHDVLNAPGRQGSRTEALAIPQMRARALMTIREAMLGRSESIALDQSVGRVSAQLVAVYPPGSALFVPGEQIELQHIKYLRAIQAQNGRVRGLDAATGTLRVVADCKLSPSLL